MSVDGGFGERVNAVVASIPKGRVMTYGQIAALCGNARAARIVGGIAHFGGAYLHTTPNCPYAKHALPSEFSAETSVETSGAHSSYLSYDSLRSSASPRFPSKCVGCGGKEIPWQRVVNKSGGLASGYPGGKHGHKQALEAEDVQVSDDFKVDVGQLLWQP